MPILANFVGSSLISARPIGINKSKIINMVITTSYNLAQEQYTSISSHGECQSPLGMVNCHWAREVTHLKLMYIEIQNNRSDH